MYKAAIIGCGARSDEHLNAYNHIDNAKAIACCDLLPEKSKGLAERHGLRAYTNADEMIEVERPDIIHIATPPNVRVDVMSLVSDLNISLCTVEKPIALGVKDWRALRELKHTSKTKFAVCHQFRWHPNLVKCQQAVASGLIGEIEMLNLSAVMNILGQGTHALNYGRSLIGDPKVKQISGKVGAWSTADHLHPGPSTTEAELIFDNGVRAHWTSGPISPLVGDPDKFWEHLRVAATGSNGHATYEEFGKWEIVSGDTTDAGNWGGSEVWKTNNELAQAEFYKAMFRWQENGEIPGTNLSDSLLEWAVILALYQSARSNHPVELEGFNPPDDLVEQMQKLHK